MRLVAGDVGAQSDLAVRVYRPDNLGDEVEVLLAEGVAGILGDLVASRGLLHRERCPIRCLGAYGEVELYSSARERCDLVGEHLVAEVV